MEHFLSYNKFSTSYDKFDINDLCEENFDEIIDNINLYEGKFGLFKKIRIWTLVPKVKNLQMKANAERLKGIIEEVEIKRKTMAVINKNREDIDLDRIKELLIKKYYATERIANVYENEAVAIANGNEYLMKVIRVEAMKGQIAENNVRMSIADEEEAEALNNLNNEAAKLIRNDIGDIKGKMKDPKYQSSEAKEAKRESGNDVPSDIDWEDLKDDTEMSYEEKEAIIKAKYRYTKSDTQIIKNFKRARLQKELRWIKGEATKSGYHDKEGIEAMNLDKLSNIGINLNQTEYDKYMEKRKQQKKK